jgi:Mg2+/citrate symporter
LSYFEPIAQSKPINAFSMFKKGSVSGAAAAASGGNASPRTVGIVCGVILGFIVVVAISFFLCRRARKRNGKINTPSKEERNQAARQEVAGIMMAGLRAAGTAERGREQDAGCVRAERGNGWNEERWNAPR